MYDKIVDNSTSEQNFEQQISHEKAQKSEKELAEEVKKKEQEYLKAKRQLEKQQLEKKLPDILELMLQNDELIETVLPLSAPEMKIIFKEIIASKEFLELFKNAVENSEKLKEFRNRKQAKSENRKLKKSSRDENTAPQNVLSNET